MNGFPTSDSVGKKTFAWTKYTSQKYKDKKQTINLVIHPVWLPRIGTDFNFSYFKEGYLLKCRRKRRETGFKESVIRHLRDNYTIYNLRFMFMAKAYKQTVAFCYFFEISKRFIVTFQVSKTKMDDFILSLFYLTISEWKVKKNGGGRFGYHVNKNKCWNSSE